MIHVKTLKNALCLIACLVWWFLRLTTIDYVNHCILLDKLAHYVVMHISQTWVKS